MTLLDPPLLFTLELHISIEGRCRYWTTPRDVLEFPPEMRVKIAQLLTMVDDAILGELGVTRRYEVEAKPLSVEDARKVLG